MGGSDPPMMPAGVGVTRVETRECCLRQKPCVDARLVGAPDGGSSFGVAAPLRHWYVAAGGGVARRSAACSLRGVGASRRSPRALCRRPLPAARRRSTARLRRHCSAWELLSSLASRCVGAAARRSLVLRGFFPQQSRAPRSRPPPTRRVRAAHAARTHPRRPCRGGGRQSRTSRLARDLLETAKACCEADRRRLRRRRAQQN